MVFLWFIPMLVDFPRVFPRFLCQAALCHIGHGLRQAFAGAFAVHFRGGVRGLGVVEAERSSFGGTSNVGTIQLQWIIYG